MGDLEFLPTGKKANFTKTFININWN